MRLLLSERNLIVAIGSDIEYGVWGNLKDVYSWKITKNSYVMDNNYTVVDIGDTEIPTYVVENEYYYVDGEFKLADECPNEYKDRIVVLEDDVLNTQIALTEQYEENIVIAEDLLNTQLALTEQFEYNIMLEDDLLNTQIALTEQYEANIMMEETIASMQEEIAELFGTKHSKKVNKFAKVLYEEEDGALMICKASNMMKCEVISVGRITDNDEDYLVQVRVLSRANNNKPFMSMVDYRKYIYEKELVK